MLQLQDIRKSYSGKEVLSGVSFHIEEGERFVLLGPSGCGKTTLLRLIAGFESPDSGRVFIDGQEVASLPVEKRPVGFIFQRHALFPHLNVYDNIATGPRIRGMPENEIAEQVKSLLRTIRMETHAEAWPQQLSGGESQRVALARAVINKPKLLLLDEPLSALDESLRQNLREELLEFQQTFNITFLFVTHDREEAMMLAHRMSVLHLGRSLQEGTPDDLYARPENSTVARFLGEGNRLPGTVTSTDNEGFTFTTQTGDVLNGKGTTPFNIGDPCQGFIRPESLYLIQEGTPSTSNTLSGTIQSRVLLGRNVRYRIRLDSGTDLDFIHTYLPPAVHLQQGATVKLGLPEEALLLFPDEAL